MTAIEALETAREKIAVLDTSVVNVMGDPGYYHVEYEINKRQALQAINNMISAERERIAADVKRKIEEAGK